MAGADMQKCLADEVLTEMSVVRICESPFSGIHEPLDIATSKKLVLFCKILYGDET